MIGFESISLEVSESAGKVEICVRISRPFSAPIEIQSFNLTVKTYAGTAGWPYDCNSMHDILWIINFAPSSDFRDFLSINQSLGGFGNSMRRQCFNVTITDDDACEDAETFTATLEKPFTGNLLISPAVVTVTILDNDGT